MTLTEIEARERRLRLVLEGALDTEARDPVTGGREVARLSALLGC